MGTTQNAELRSQPVVVSVGPGTNLTYPLRLVLLLVSCAAALALALDVRRNSMGLSLF